MSENTWVLGEIVQRFTNLQEVSLIGLSSCVRQQLWTFGAVNAIINKVKTKSLTLSKFDTGNADVRLVNPYVEELKLDLGNGFKVAAIDPELATSTLATQTPNSASAHTTG